MPNGHREPYRYRGGLSNPPSPAHSSDSEETAANKREYHKEKREQELAARSEALQRNKILPPKLRSPEICLNIAKFL